MKATIINSFFIAFLAIACKNKDESSGDKNTEAKIPLINYAVIRYLPHDTTSYTEGFLFHNSQLYESTGYDSSFPFTRSLFGLVDSITGGIHVKAELDKKTYFGEGIVFLKNKIYQLTYTTKIGFIYDAATFKQIGEFKFPSEQGWGMTTDGQYLVMSDGTSDIHYLDPDTMKPVKAIRVTDENGVVGEINELEFINGYLYANVYKEDYIIKIDTATGNIVGKINLASLKKEALQRYPGAQQLNGIAYNAGSDKIYVTGKLWPNIYEIAFAH